MKISQVMTKNPQTVTPNSTLVQAAEKMSQFNFGAIPVVANGQVQGILTDRDITLAIAKHKNPEQVQVREFMTDSVSTCFDDQDVQEAVKLMESKQIRRLPVLNRQNQLIGIVALGDLATRNQNQQLSGEVLEQVSQNRQASQAA